MNAQRALAAEQTIALAGVVTAEVLSTKDDRNLPRPRRLLAVLLFYGTLSLIASFGQGPARFAAASGGVVALSALLFGVVGAGVKTLLNRGAGLLGAPQSPGLPAWVRPGAQTA